MLVLTRKKDEEIVITTPSGERIVMQVCEIQGDKVRFGFRAAREVEINRKEVQDRIDAGEPLPVRNKA